MTRKTKFNIPQLRGMTNTNYAFSFLLLYSTQQPTNNATEEMAGPQGKP
jgi:hypothetical protein